MPELWPAKPHPPLPTTDIISWIFDKCDYDPDKPIYVDASNPSRSISWSKARKTVRHLVAGFHALGVRKGDCVFVHASNDIYYPILFHGIVAAGAVWAGSNPAYTPTELTHHIKTTQAKFFISEPEILSSLLEATKSLNVPKENVVIFHPLPDQTVPKGFESWTSLLSHGERDWVRFDDYDLCSTTEAGRFATSGTTGLPKATRSTHLNFIAEHENNFGHLNPTITHPATPKTHLWPMPMFHMAVAPSSHTTCIKNGETAYIMRHFHLENFMKYIELYQVDTLLVVPPIVIAVIMNQELQRKYSFKSVRFVLRGAAPLGKREQARFRELCGEGAVMNQVWGMTESTCIAMRFNHSESDLTGSLGRLIDGVSAKLLHPDTGAPINTYDTPGEICLKGAIVIPGYFNNPAADRDSFDKDGYFHTGDIMYCAKESGLWYIVDRKKELIKVRGMQVAPPEVEGVLLEMEGVVDVAVIGVEVGGFEGEVVRAYVVRRPGGRLTEEEVKEWVKVTLSRYKWLEGGVVFVDAIPKNPSGKILKRVLREMAKKELGLGKESKL